MVTFKNYDNRRRFLTIKLLAVLICLVLLGGSGYAQKKVGYAYLDTGDKKIVDLSKKTTQECTESIRKESGQSFVEVRFQPQFSSEAEDISQVLKKVVEKTQEILSPLSVNGVRFYLLQMDNAPKSYKIVLPKQDNLFLYLEVFGKKESLSLDCVQSQEFCRKLYQTIPHEITHPVLENLIDHDEVRWFDDGLAEYVGNEIMRQLAPSMATREKEISAQATLHREEIRRRLFGWNDLNSLDFAFKSEKGWRNEAQTYEATQQLIRLMIEESKKRGVERPLAVLLKKLKQKVNQTGKPVNREELFALITQYLKVDVRALGKLDAQTQQSLVQEAIEMLAKEKNAPNLQNKFYALNVLASIDEIALPEEWIKFLIEIAYNAKEDDYIRALAATALARRVNQDNFDRPIEKLRETNSLFGEKKVDSIKRDLQRQSFRPAPK